MVSNDENHPRIKPEPVVAASKEARQPESSYQQDRRRRHAARRHFHAAPAFRIAFEADGMAVLCMKSYEYWPNRPPEDATTYQVLSRHRTLEEAERRLQLICGGPIYYDESGRPMRDGPRPHLHWGVPTDDD